MCRRNDSSSDERIVEYLFFGHCGKSGGKKRGGKDRLNYSHICLLVPLVMAQSMFDFQQIILGNSKTMLQHMKQILLELAKRLVISYLLSAFALLVATDHEHRFT